MIALIQKNSPERENYFLCCLEVNTGPQIESWFLAIEWIHVAY